MTNIKTMAKKASRNQRSKSKDVVLNSSSRDDDSAESIPSVGSSSKSEESPSPQPKPKKKPSSSVKTPVSSKQKKSTSGDKSKGKSVVQTTTSGKDSLFVSEIAETRFQNVITRRPPITECLVNLSDFPEFKEVVSKRKWMKTISDIPVPILNLVQEFYANFSNTIDEEGDHTGQVSTLR